MAEVTPHTQQRWMAVLGGVLALATAAVFARNLELYGFLSDDAFISFRFAENLAEGHGAVFNPSERVEGYTNPLWVLVLALGLRIGLQPEGLSLWLGGISGALLLLALSRREQRNRPWTSPFAWLAPLALASTPCFAAWCSGGLETGFFTLLVYMGLTCASHELEHPLQAPARSSLWLSLAAVTRSDGAIFLVVPGAFLLLQVVRGRRSVRSMLSWLAPPLCILGGHFLLRRMYYGQWMPNTYYAKVSGAYWEQGWNYLSLYLRQYPVLWFAPTLLLAMLSAGSRLRLLSATLVLVYLASVGGDRLEFRFLVPLLPLLYGSVLTGLERFAGKSAWRTPLALVAGLALVGTGWIGAQRELSREERGGMAALPGIKRYAQGRMRQGRELRAAIDAGELPTQVVLGTGGVGALPYYSRWETIDRRGLTDAHIAREPRSTHRKRRIAHEREASIEYLVERGVEVFTIYNRLLFDTDKGASKGRREGHNGQLHPLRAVAVGHKFMVFISFVSDERLEEVFGVGQVRGVSTE